MIKSETLISGTTAWDGSLLPPYPATQPEVIIKQITIDADERLDPHLHPVINAGYVMAGTLTVISADGTSRQFRAGDAIIEMVGKVHYGENRGSEPVRLIMFYASSPGIPLSVEQG